MSRIVLLIADMKEPDDDASIPDSAIESCSVVTGSTSIGTVHNQQYHEVRNCIKLPLHIRVPYLQ
jgi:hypothetical protein